MLPIITQKTLVDDVVHNDVRGNLATEAAIHTGRTGLWIFHDSSAYALTIFLVLTHFLVIDNVIQEFDQSYSILVLLQDMQTYSDNSCLINYTTINFLIKK